MLLIDNFVSTHNIVLNIHNQPLIRSVLMQEIRKIIKYNNIH